MTSAYEAGVTPDEIDIRCPKCGDPARFRFGLAGVVESKAERAAVEAHPAYELGTIVERGNNRRTVVIYHEWLDVGERLPFNGTSLARYVFREFADRGACLCGSCRFRDRHQLRWPDDALFSCEVRGETLWAWTRKHAVVLRDYIASRIGIGRSLNTPSF